MTVGDLKKLLSAFSDDLDVMTQKTEILGNVGHVNCLYLGDYQFFGRTVPCLYLSDKYYQLYEDTDFYQYYVTSSPSN